jgi:hypothetical protein
MITIFRGRQLSLHGGEDVIYQFPNFPLPATGYPIRSLALGGNQ